MPANSKIFFPLAGLLVVAAVLFDLWLWQPERQVLKHQAHLLHALETRNWARVDGFFDAQYSDRWHHDKTSALRESREILRQFFVLSINGEIVSVQADGLRGTVVARLKFDGTGTELAQLAQEKVNALPTPFSFAWQRQSWRPWDWQLAGVDNEELQIDGDH